MRHTARSAGRWVLAAAAALAMLAVLVVCLSRLSYPFELEWTEGANVDHVRRILDGKPLYAEPAAAFTAYGYTPLYYYLAAPLLPLFNNGFLALRILSLLASLGCMWTIGRLILCLGGSRWTAWVGAGLFAASFRAGGAWFDIARPDMLFLFLCLLGSLCVVRCGTERQAGVAGLVFAAAFFCKQTALLACLPLMLFLLLKKPRLGLVSIGSFVLIAGSSTWLFDLATDDWFSFYVFALPGARYGTFFKLEKLTGFWPGDMLGVMPVATLLSLGIVGSCSRRFRELDGLFFPALFAGLVVASWASRSELGGYDNTLLPAYAGCAAGVGVALQRIEAWSAQSSRGRQRVALLIVLLVVWQFFHLRFSINAQIPTDADRRSGEQLVEFVKGFPGGVMLPQHGYLETRAGKETSAHALALSDIVLSVGLEPQRSRLAAAYGRRFASGEIDAVMVSDWLPVFVNEMLPHFDRHSSYFTAGEDFLPVTGRQVRPRQLWIRKGFCSSPRRSDAHVALCRN